MKEVIHFLVKGWLKSKYILFLPIAVGLLIIMLLVVNSSQSGATQQELQETFNNRKENVHLLIASMLKKERAIGLTSEEQLSLDSLLLKEEYLKEILKKLNDENLHIAAEQLAYLNEYEKYTTFKSIPYLGENAVKVEQSKAEALLDHNLSYSEQITPFKTALFTKQLFQILFSPITAFLILLIFCYKYLADKENRTFDFFQINSLSNKAIYYGYLIPLLMVVLVYIFIACFLSLLPTLLTGNINTIFYPIEVAVSSEIVLVPVWKWLVFIPIGWGIFISVLLVLIICLFKQQATLGLLFALVSLPILASYMISLKAGFQMANPIHLIVSYENHLLPTNRFAIYLFTMLFLLTVCFIISYIIIAMKNTGLKLPEFKTNKKQHPMTGKLKLLQFEHVKKKRKGHILLTFILLFWGIGGTVAAVNQQFQNAPATALKAIENDQNTTIGLRTHWELVAADFELEKEMQRLIDGTEIDDGDFHANTIKQLDHRYEVLESLKGEVYSTNFFETYRKTMKLLEPGSYKDENSTLWNITEMASEEQQNILDGKGITPWPLGHKWISKFDAPSQAISNEHYVMLKLTEERNMKYDNSSLFAIYKYLDWNVMFVVLLLFVLLLWTTISEEHSPTPTISFLVTKPIRFTSVYITKWAYNLAVSCSLLLISGAFIFLIATMIGGVGEAEYPMLIYATDRQEAHFFLSTANNAYFYFENLSTVIVKSGVLIFTQIFFLNSLFSLVGKFMKNHYASIIVTLIIVIAGYFIGDHYIELTGSAYNPFVYFDTWNIVDGWKSVEANNGQVNFLNGTAILFIGGSLLFCMGLLFRRRVAS
ncbi:hypothetical protein ACTHOQ_00445 [Solibacillus silvestris]|uniref:hypothetical protein n=1 Tax=Solibacillus silvestris TaxID=76853 RepID=UPI003F81F946